MPTKMNIDNPSLPFQKLISSQANNVNNLLFNNERLLFLRC